MTLGPENGETAKNIRFSEAQLAFVLRQAAEATAIGDMCRTVKISEATLDAWRKSEPASMHGSSTAGGRDRIWAIETRDASQSSPQLHGHRN